MCGGSFCQSELNKPGGHRSEASVGRCTPHLAVTCSLCIGLFFCVFGMVSYAAFGPILRQQVKANLIIDPSNEVYENWKETPVPIYVSMFLFNYTNPDDIILGAKPKLQQLGPFVYRERRQKVNITFNGNGTVSYRQLLSYEHLPELSASSLDVKLYTLNVPMIGAAYKNRKTPSNEEQPMASALEEMFSKMNQSLLIHRTVRELLFDGYEDQMLKLAKQWSWSPTTRFGYQIDRNNSNDGIYTVFTGENGMANYGTIESWQGRHRVIGFRKSCSFINGTTGEMWPPYTLTSKSSLLFFTSPLCRSLRLDFLRNEVVKGIQVLRYHLNERLFDYSIEENQCFCSKKKGKDPECFPNGVLDLSRCQSDAPIVVSLPHLLYASPSITEAVEGLSPDPQLHEFFMDVEPSMGIPLRVSAKVQMNVIVDAFKYFKYFEMFETRKFLPTFWIETAAVVNDDFAFKIRLVVQDLGSYVSFASYAWVLIGLFIIMFTLGYVIAHTRRSVRRKYMTKVRPDVAKGTERPGKSLDTYRVFRITDSSGTNSGSRACYDKNNCTITKRMVKRSAICRGTQIKVDSTEQSDNMNADELKNEFKSDSNLKLEEEDEYRFGNASLIQSPEDKSENVNDQNTSVPKSVLSGSRENPIIDNNYKILVSTEQGGYLNVAFEEETLPYSAKTEIISTL